MLWILFPKLRRWWTSLHFKICTIETEFYTTLPKSSSLFSLLYPSRRRRWHPTPVLLLGKSHGRRSLVGCSPWGPQRVGQDWATSLSLLTLMHWRRKWQPTPVFLPGESQGWGAWWAAVYGVTQSQTQLKWLSSSSSMKKLKRKSDLVLTRLETCILSLRTLLWLNEATL